MLILLNATSKNRLLKSIKITGGLGIALALQACSGLYPTKNDNAGTAPPRVWTATEWLKSKEQSAPVNSNIANTANTNKPATVVATPTRTPAPAVTDTDFLAIHARSPVPPLTDAEILAFRARPPVPPSKDTEILAIRARPAEAPLSDTAPVARPPHRSEQTPLTALPDPVIESNQCWAHMVKNPLTQERLTPVVTRESSVSHDISPAVVQQKQQTVTVKDSAQTFMVVPPRFKAVQEQVKISDEIRRIQVVPAVYEDKTVEVLVESARTVLQTCSAPGQRPASPDARSLQKTQCIREIPARYQTITKKTLVAPETTREEIIPAQYQTVLRWVLEENGQAQARELPAEQIALPYRSVQQEPRVTTKTRAPEVRDIAVTVHTGTPQLVWRQVLCERDLSRPLIEKLQSALVSAGEDLGKPDGKLGPKTWRAIQSYQNKQRLAVGLLSFETLHGLGVSHTNSN